MYGATKGVRRMLVTGVVGLVLLTSIAPASQASTGKNTSVDVARSPWCWICW